MRHLASLWSWPGLSRSPRLFLLFASTSEISGTNQATTAVCINAIEICRGNEWIDATKLTDRGGENRTLDLLSRSGAQRGVSKDDR